MGTYQKRLIEVALPLSEVNDASAHDKLPGIGAHPKNMHQWWARLPLPTARAVLFASIIGDPSETPEFAKKSEQEQNQERERLFLLMRKLLAKKPTRETFDAARREMRKASHGELPPVLDPFCGGGSIPLEAQRLGFPVFAADLNPVAVLLTRAWVDLPQRFATTPPVSPNASPQKKVQLTEWQRAKGLAQDVRSYGRWVGDEAEKRIGHLYPSCRLPPEHGSGEATPIVWLWARTAKCPNPACGARMPLVRSFKLSTKKHSEVWIEPRIDKSLMLVNFVVQVGEGETPDGTVSHGGATCIVCQTHVPFDHLRAEGEGGRLSVQLLAIVCEGSRGRAYISPRPEQEKAAKTTPPKDAPDTSLPARALGFRVQAYGMKRHRDLFTPRQLVALTTLSDLVLVAIQRAQHDAIAAGLSDDGVGVEAGGTGARAYGETVGTYLSLAVDRLADYNCALTRWSAGTTQVKGLFGRQAISMVWDFAESNIFSNRGITWANEVEYVSEAIENTIVGNTEPGAVLQRDVIGDQPFGKRFLLSTDPPYYDNIGYADLSDFFYVWLRRALKESYPQLFSTYLTPKTQELVATPDRFDGDKAKAKQHFENGFRTAFEKLAPNLDPRFPMTLYYAFKQEEEKAGEPGGDELSVTLTTGWETFLEALLQAGFRITGTWPIRASQQWRMRATDSNALASYIVIACRPRAHNAPLATRREFVTGLKRDLPGALRKLQQGSIAPVDMAQASIGPGMAVFSNYSKVIEADGSPMSVRVALQLINGELEAFLRQEEGEADRDTQFCVSWFEQYGMATGPFGEADVLARAKNTSVEGLVQAGVLTGKGGKVALLPRSNYPSGWDPATDNRLSLWECTQHLVKRYQEGGETAASALHARFGPGRSEDAKNLAYRLYAICERKGWAEEALAYNEFVVARPEILKKAAALSGEGPQKTLEAEDKE